MTKLRMLFVSLFLCFFLLSALTTACMATSEDEAASKISEAENAVGQTFQVVLEVEKIGGNVSGLVDRLNEAGGLLTAAKIAYENMDLDEAVIRADLCSAVTSGVLEDALTLKSLALADAQAAFWLTLTFSLEGAAVFVVTLVFGWGWFKRLYVKKLLKMKPEVASDIEA